LSNSLKSSAQAHGRAHLFVLDRGLLTRRLKGAEKKTKFM